MLVLSYVRRGIKRYECWFCEDNQYEGKFTRFFQSNLLPKKSFFQKEKETWIIQLDQWDYSQINKKTRYDINRIQNFDSYKDIYKWSDINLEKQSEIIGSYNDFARAKGITLMNEERLRAAEKNVLYTRVNIGTSFSHHIYLGDKTRIRLLYSWALLDKTAPIISAGLNKMHTAFDIDYAKETGISKFDFGGFKSARMNGIDKFKSRFGGTNVIEFNYFKLL